MVVLFIALKIGLIKINTFWKISPVIWLVALFFVLFVPMQWGAPAGAARMYQSVIEIIPSVNGEVIDVPVKPLVPVKKGDVLFVIDPTQYKAEVAQLEAQIALAGANLDRAQDLMDRKVGRQLDVDIYAAEMQSAAAQLDNALWELDKTVVRAPADGQVVGLTLRPGQRVSNMPLRSWVAFELSDAQRMAVGIPQSRLRHVEVGQKVELVLRMFPGRTLNATVTNIIDINSSAQLQPSGIIPDAPSAADLPLPYGVVIELDDEDELPLGVPGGAVGTAAIYTDSVAATHVIRKVMMRMEAWTNYLKP